MTRFSVGSDVPSSSATASLGRMGSGSTPDGVGCLPYVVLGEAATHGTLPVCRSRFLECSDVRSNGCLDHAGIGQVHREQPSQDFRDDLVEGRSR